LISFRGLFARFLYQLVTMLCECNNFCCESLYFRSSCAISALSVACVLQTEMPSTEGDVQARRQRIAQLHISARNLLTQAGELATIGETDQGEGMKRERGFGVCRLAAFFRWRSAIERACPAGEGSA
jgi:hypothetical protein